MPDYTIGIDTGGTYTDAVVIKRSYDQNSGVNKTQKVTHENINNNILASVKSLTTHGNLAAGISDALAKALAAAIEKSEGGFNASDVSLVSLSTTLATNALVEGQGSSLGVFTLGFDEAMVERTEIAKAIPDALLLNVNGGHLYTGIEQQPLDIDAIRTALKGNMGKVDAYAVAGHYAVRNQAHERQAQQLISELTGAPVTASCDLSDSLNGPKRALTAAFNAKIVSLILQLENAVRKSMSQLGLDAPIMIVKGDGSIAGAESVMQTPIETILSGPAASVIGARYLTGEKDFLISDIGGTTTDVATVIKGWPALNDRGADVGGYRTLVKAIDMKTLGLGGDSEVDIDGLLNLSVLSNRTLPLSMLATQWPQVEKELKQALMEQSGMRSAIQYLLLIPTDSSDFSQYEKEFISLLSTEKPILYRNLVASAKDRNCLRRLMNRGVVKMSGFTPSDAAHVLGYQSQWNTQAAKHACELLGRATGLVVGTDVETEIKSLAQKVHDAVVDKSTRLLINQLAGREFDVKDPLVTAAANGNSQINDLKVQLHSKLPIVAVGGPAKIFYPNVAERLGQEVLVPEYSHVANAIGAAVGFVKSVVTIEITLHENGHYLIHATDQVLSFDTATEALEQARRIAIEFVKNDMQSKGANLDKDMDVKVDVSRVDIPGMEKDASLISATVKAECESSAK
ncbi:MAG: hydantoinase/oxoprolinase family protein [Kangiellaceae bacterium]